MGYFILAILAGLGFLASLVCHVMGWLHFYPPGGNTVFLLHIGVFPLWIPLVIFSNRTMPKGAKGNAAHVQAEVPRWLRRVSAVLFAYALLNFVYFLYSTSQYPKHEVPHYVELRGFSGHWMLFYAMAGIGFVGLGRLARKRKEELRVEG